MDEKTLYLMIGDKIRTSRQKTDPKMSQVALAEKVGVTRASIVNIEAGRQRAPLHLLWNIAEALGTETALLIPRQAEIVENDLPVRLDETSIHAIEEAASGDLQAKRLLTQFVSRAKSKLQ